ncbi:2Fe-2S iron-sulfur cluster-binding protein [Rhodococcus opacus]|uniref:Ferredoxin n=1 Tax=Rhodococcus opacus TaxID=37919 RepID=A0A2S8J4K3_RHOOP|nr:2Fe-2S iron-sulfur cluster-binding protein [Rhodococcus opacus]PQP21991.1 ferredoxin [Rhodococcus opacus]
MPTITYIQPDGEPVTVESEEGMSVMETATSNSVDGIIGECGGNASCGTCHVYVDLEWLDRLDSIGGAEEEMLEFVAEARESNSRLGCQIPLVDRISGISVTVPASQI